MRLIGELELGEAFPVLGNHQEVYLCDWIDISECHAQVIFVDHGRWNFLGDDFVENCDFLSLSSLGLGLFVHD